MKKRTMLALLAAAPAVAFAQMGGKRRSGDKSGAGGAKGGGGPQINQLEATLGEFETDLNLTSAQQKAWNAYAEGIRALRRISRATARRAPPMRSSTSPSASTAPPTSRATG